MSMRKPNCHEDIVHFEDPEKKHTWLKLFNPSTFLLGMLGCVLMALFAPSSIPSYLFSFVNTPISNSNVFYSWFSMFGIMFYYGWPFFLALFGMLLRAKVHYDPVGYANRYLRSLTILELEDLMDEIGRDGSHPLAHYIDHWWIEKKTAEYRETLTRSLGGS